MKKRFSEEQIIGFLREAEAGLPVQELCRRHGFSEASYYLWRSKFGGMSVPDAKRWRRALLEQRLHGLVDGNLVTLQRRQRSAHNRPDRAWRRQQLLTRALNRVGDLLATSQPAFRGHGSG